MNDRSRLLQTAAGTSSVRIANMGLLFLSNILLTRVLGVEGYGVYAYAMSWTVFVHIIATLGCKNLVVREVSANLSQQNWGLIRGLLQWSSTIVFLFSLLVAATLGAIALLFQPHPQILLTLWIALPLVPLMAITTVRQAAMRGFRHIVQGQLPENLVQPLLFMVLVGGLLLWEVGDLSPPLMMALRVVSGTVACSIGGILLVRIMPKDIRSARAEYEPAQWMPSMLSMLFTAGASTLFTQSDAIMLGLFTGTAEVGIYTVTLRGARFILMGLQIGVAVIGPHIASLYAEGKREELQQLTTKSIRAILAYALPVGVVLIIFGRWFLAIFGEDFVAGQTVLTILCVGQLVNAATGSVGLLLIMTHHERDNMMVIGTTAVLNGMMNLVLIPQWGAIGAAIATTTATIIANIWLAVLVYKRLGIYATVFGSPSLGNRS